MVGTAFPANRILLVEQPGSWGPSGLITSQFDPTIAATVVNRLGAQGIRTLTIRRPGRQPAVERRRWGFADCRPGHRRLVWGDFGDDEELLRLDPTTAVGDASLGPAFLVCAHGTHDQCCAIEGRPVAAALNQICPGQAWECSHVGGDRFAANVLALPSGQLYGRVSMADAAEMVSAATAGRLLPRLLRGLVGLTPPAQVAKLYAARELGLLGLDDLTVTGVQQSNADVVVRLTTAAELVMVALTVRMAEPEQLTCRGVGTARARYYQPVSLGTQPRD